MVVEEKIIIENYFLLLPTAGTVSTVCVKQLNSFKTILTVATYSEGGNSKVFSF